MTTNLRRVAAFAVCVLVAVGFTAAPSAAEEPAPDQRTARF